MLYDVQVGLLRVGALTIGDPLPGPLWLAVSGIWEQIRGIPPATVVKIISGDAERPVTGAVQLADDSIVLIWDGNGYEIDTDGTGPAVHGRPAKYCSRACRARAYRERVAAEQQGTAALAKVAGAALSVDRVVRAAIELVDREGGTGPSMRRTAAELDVGVMSLYRYVSGKEELGRLMIDAIFGDHSLPEPGPPSWRAKLELSARQEWQIYREHPWIPQLFALTTRPPVAPRLMAYTDWRIRAVDDLGLDVPTMVRIAIVVSTHTQSAAYPLAREQFANNTREEWLGARSGEVRETLASGALPMVARFGADAFEASQPQSIFEFGLRCLLDGVADMISARPRDTTRPSAPEIN